MLVAVVVLAGLVAQQARIVELHEGTAFIDRGSVAGLVVGAHVPVVRKGVVVGDCVVVDVSDHRAACSADSALAVDDTLVVAAPGNTAPSPQRRRREASPSTLQALRADTAAHIPTLVPHTRRRVRSAPVWRDGGHVTFTTGGTMSTTMPGATSMNASVDAAVFVGLEGLTGIVGSFARGAVRVSSDMLPSSPDRFRPGALVEPYVFEAAIGIDDDRNPWRLLVGRFFSAQAVGLPMLDGLQIGHALSRHIEVGVFAGTTPGLVTVAPTARPLAGVYSTGRFTILDGLQLVPRARAGVVVDPRGGLRADSEADVQLHGGAGLFVSAGARVITSSTSSLSSSSPLVSIARAHVDGDYTILPWLQVFAGFRHQGAIGLDLDIADLDVDRARTDRLATLTSTRHADLGVRVPLWSVVAFTVQGGVIDHDIDDVASYGVEASDVVDVAVTETAVFGAAAGDVRRGFFAASIDVPRVFTDAVGVGIGAQQELGTSAGRFAYGQVLLRPRRQASVVVRGSVGALAQPQLGDEQIRDVGLATFVDIEVLPGLSLRTRAQGQQVLAMKARPAHGPTSTVTFDAAITARW